MITRRGFARHLSCLATAGPFVHSKFQSSWPAAWAARSCRWGSRLRVTIGTEGEMARFCDVFWQTYSG
jgi:hypothetical protein